MLVKYSAWIRVFLEKTLAVTAEDVVLLKDVAIRIEWLTQQGKPRIQYETQQYGQALNN